jgi:hypothetical protein
MMIVEVVEVTVEDRDTLVGLRVAASPTLFAVALSATKPVKPFSPVTVMVVVVEPPGFTDRGEGVPAVTMKSLIIAVTAKDWTRVAPLGSVSVPLTVPG